MIDVAELRWLAEKQIEYEDMIVNPATVLALLDELELKTKFLDWTRNELAQLQAYPERARLLEVLKAADKLVDEVEDALASNDGRISYVRQAIAEYRSSKACADIEMK